MLYEEKVSLTISITKACRDRLREIAARQNLENPDQVTSASTIAKQIILRNIGQCELGDQSA
jgi:hypothetical protein